MHRSSKFTEHVDILCECDSSQIAVHANVQLLKCDNYVTNRKIPYFKQFIRCIIRILCLYLESSTPTSMFEILH